MIQIKIHCCLTEFSPGLISYVNNHLLSLLSAIIAYIFTWTWTWAYSLIPKCSCICIIKDCKLIMLSNSTCNQACLPEPMDVECRVVWFRFIKKKWISVRTAQNIRLASVYFYFNYFSRFWFSYFLYCMLCAMLRILDFPMWSHTICSRYSHK